MLEARERRDAALEEARTHRARRQVAREEVVAASEAVRRRPEHPSAPSGGRVGTRCLSMLDHPANTEPGTMTRTMTAVPHRRAARSPQRSGGIGLALAGGGPLGGIYEVNKNNTVSKVPGLGDIPGIGALFRDTKRTTSKAELLIFVTPRILSDTLQ